MSYPTPSVVSMLTDEQTAILDFERLQWTHPGAKETAIVERFGMLAPSYYAKVNHLIDQPEALKYAPHLVNRLRRLRAARIKVRQAR